VAETRSKTQLPSSAITPPPAGEASQALRRGLQVGRDYAETATRRIGAWAEENPGQVLLAGLALGFLLGKLLSRRPSSDLDERVE
jgi:hypothetical protein